LKWFSRKSADQQRKVLEMNDVRSLRFTYSEEDAREAVKNSMTWFDDPGFVFRIMVAASVALVEVGMAGAAIYLMRECEGQLKLTGDQRALCRHNVGMDYRELGDTASATVALEKALNSWKEIGEHPGDEAIEHAYLAELFKAKGKKD